MPKTAGTYPFGPPIRLRANHTQGRPVLTELQTFLAQWQRATEGTEALLRALPLHQYDLRPDPDGRSLGQLAWHLAELEAYASVGIEQRHFKFDVKPPRSQRPLTITALLPAFRLVHADAVERIARLQLSDLDLELDYADGTRRSIRDLLWGKLLLHGIHHRGQLVVLCRLAGGFPPALFGPTREQTAARRAAAAHQAKVIS